MARIAVYLIAFWVACSAAHAQERPRRVLLLYPYDNTTPSAASAGAAIRKRLEERSPEKIEFYADFLDLARFPTETDELRTAHHVAEKYAGRSFDIVMPLNFEAQRFAIKYRELMAPNVPLVFCCVTADAVVAIDRQDGVTGVYGEFDLAKTLALAERLQPRAQNLVVISGSSDIDRRWLEPMRRQIQPYEGRFETNYWIGIRYERLLEQVAHLSRETIVVFVTVFDDGTGRPFLPAQVAQDIAKVSSAPVYTPSGTDLGRGVVGGYMDTYEAAGIAAADLALEVLAGKDPNAIVPRQTEGRYRVDARQLQRWQLAEKNLPPDTILYFKGPTLWEQHGNLILVSSGVVLLQSLLIAALLMEIFGRRRAERFLKESEAQWRSVFEMSTAGVALTDRDLRFLGTNPAFQSMLGYTDQELQGLTPLDITFEDDREVSRQLHSELLLEQRQYFDLVRRYRRKDGATIWVHAYLSTILDEDSRPRLFLVTTIDITARKAAEDAVQVAQSELVRVGRLTMMGEMTASIAHEVNQPLGAIVANGNAGLRWLAQARPDLEEARAAFRRVVDEGHRAGQVITSIRSMFKKDGSAKAPHDVNELVREVLVLVHGEVENQRVAVRTEMIDELPHVLIDRGQLLQVILNLVTNAIDAMGSNNGRARVLRLRSERHESASVKVTVEDSGTGIDEENMDRIFEAFFTTKSHGMGMGLSICRSIVESHGGQLSASRGYPYGAVFQVVLPGHQPGAE
jgi:PAS domain S-box-containing protein